MTYLLEPDDTVVQALTGVLGADTTVLASAEALRWQLRDDKDTFAIVVGPSIDQDTAFATADSVRLTRPDISVILVRRRVDTHVMGLALRAGIREVVSEREPGELQDAVRRAAELAGAVRQTSVPGEAVTGERHRNGKVVTVFSAKGGAGKTTSAVNIAAQLAAGGQRSVCLVDLDLSFGDVGVSLGLKPAHTIAEAVALGEGIDAEATAAMLTRHSPGLSVLQAPTEPAVAESVTPQITNRVIEQLRGQFDYVVVDTPPAFTEVVLGAFDNSNMIVLIATMDVPTLKNIKLTLETLDVLDYPRDRWRLVLNRVDEKAGLTVADVQKVLGAKVDGMLPISREVLATVNHGVAISLEHPNHPVSVNYQSLVDKVIVPGTGGAAVSRPATGHASKKQRVPATQSTAPRKGFFARRKALAS